MLHFQPSNQLPSVTLGCRRMFASLTPALVVFFVVSTTAHAQNAAPATPTIYVNVLDERHPISPLIYGGNFPKDGEFIRTTGTRLSRWGGNDATSYNWKLHLKNICADWYFENFSDDNTIDWVKRVQDAGSAAVVGIAMVDWTPKAAGDYSFSVK